MFEFEQQKLFNLCNSFVSIYNEENPNSFIYNHNYSIDALKKNFYQNV